MLAMDQISRMSSAERLATMELLWESFAKEGIDYPSPAWHGPILAARSELIDSDKADWLTVDELQDRLMNR
jgi:putative addiction module component (TIGR02574 family)